MSIAEFAQPTREIAESIGAEIAQRPGHESERASSLVSQISFESTRVITKLIEEFNVLRDDLKNEGDRLQMDIVAYTALGQSAIELQNILSDNVARIAMPQTPSVSTGVLEHPTSNQTSVGTE